MSERDHTDQHNGCGDDVAAYVLGALDADEAERFRVHMETCVVCRDEFLAFREVVDVMPLTAPAYRAPRSLRRRVRRAVVDDIRGRAPSTAPRARRFALPRPALALSAVATAAVAAVVLVLALGSSSGPSTRLISAQVTGPGTASLRLSGGHTELIVHDFAAPPAGEIYEVWLQRGQRTPTPAGQLFDVDQHGNTAVQVPGSLHGVTRVMVTPEPAGGAPRPTHAPVISAQLSST